MAYQSDFAVNGICEVIHLFFVSPVFVCYTTWQNSLILYKKVNNSNIKIYHLQRKNFTFSDLQQKVIKIQGTKHSARGLCNQCKNLSKAHGRDNA